MTATRTAKKRAPRAAAARSAKRAPTAKLGVRDAAVCVELDRLDDDDEIAYLGNNVPSAMKVIRDLDAETRERTHEMIEVQRVYMQLLEDMIDPVDQNGRTHDMRGMESTRLAICWTLALCGYRRTAQAYIRKRQVKDIPGVYQGCYVWVDARAPEKAEDQIRPEDRSDNKLLPPDVRSMVAIRNGDEPKLLAEWHVKVDPKIEFEPRPRDW